MAETVDPRISRTRKLVFTAARELLADVGYGKTTIEGISERSGVARSTIYRHWPELSQLVVESVQEIAPALDTFEEGDLRENLIAMLTVMASTLAQPRNARLTATLTDAATRDADLAVLHSRFSMARRRPTLVTLQRAIDRGEIKADTDIDEIATILISPLFFRRFYTHEGVDTDFIERHTDRVLSEILVNDPATA